MRWRFFMPLLLSVVFLSAFGVRIFFYAGVTPSSIITYIYLVLCPFLVVYGVRALEKE